ncbi:MAG: DNA-processing protein DprA [Acidimicrobiia bacterium]|nr:DNA-processing protein DprA [Acidimicrobiia bacterium]
MDDQAKAVIALASRLGDSQRPSLSPTRWHRFTTNLYDAGLMLADVFATDFDTAKVPGIDGDIAAAVDELLTTAAAATVEASELERHGIRVITIVDEDYPQPFVDRLGKLAPPVIYAVGNLSLMRGDGIGIVGSRNIDEAGKNATEQIAELTVEHGRSVVSGGARGVDQFAMNAAFMAGGTVIGVLADSLQGKIRNGDMLRAIDSGTVCLLSQQIPSAGFTPASAMGRNKLVYSLTETTVVIASDLDKGGTWAGATEALKKGFCDVAIWQGPGGGPGNDRLVSLGGRPVSNPADVFRRAESPTSTGEQLRLA